MRYIAKYIQLIWLTSFILAVAPFHDVANVPNLFYSLIILTVVFVTTNNVKGGLVIVGKSWLSNNAVSKLLLAASFLILISSIITLLCLMYSSSGSLSANREIFNSQYTIYSYIYVFFLSAPMFLALSKYSSEFEKKLGAVSWLSCILTLLFSGNRQLAFFSAVYVCFYKLGRSTKPSAFFWKSIGFGFFLLIAALAFSIMRLDYLPDSDSETVAAYMANLTGAECHVDFLCKSPVESIFLLLYAYLGINQSGIKYCIDYFYSYPAFPISSVTFPLLHRRLIDLGLSVDVEPYLTNLNNYVTFQASGDYSMFFSTYFGAFALEFGWFGILVISIILNYIVKISCMKCTSSDSQEVNYFYLILILTFLVIGVMQNPFAEPFFCILILQFYIFTKIGTFFMPISVNQAHKNSPVLK